MAEQYVKIKAVESDDKKNRTISGGAEISVSVTIRWEFEGGLTGTHGWTVNPPSGGPIEIIPVANDVEATNRAIVNAYGGSISFTELFRLGNCAVMGI